MRVFRSQRHITVVGALALLLMAAGIPSIALGQERPDPAALISAQQDAMKQFAVLDGVWRGTAWMMLPSGEKHHMTQTERVGPFLDGSVRVIEGRSYEEDGSVGFNALGIISYNSQSDAYSMRSYAQGQSGDFVITPVEDGFQWEIPAGPMTIRYTAMVSENTWTEVGEQIRDGGTVVRFYEMKLTRVGDTSWPGAGAIVQKDQSHEQP
jgi:hypothetical protein